MADWSKHLNKPASRPSKAASSSGVPRTPKEGDPPEVFQAWAKYHAARQPDIKDLIRKPVSHLELLKKEYEKDIAADDWRKPYATAQLAVVNHPDLANWTVKKFHQRKAHDGVAFSCDLYYKGVKAGSAEQDGWGGPDRVQIAASAQAAWDELCKVCSDNGWGSVESFSGVLEVVLRVNGK